ncbi:hypothetical protein GCM10025770_24480 [Viridibacterium curvum]|uniref:Fibronectin type-III domain-containing protein n=2 Tax=Viridibacterium curvum TaxID=1101404 RepID=A0ABP9QSH1_9RHOO
MGAALALCALVLAAGVSLAQEGRGRGPRQNSDALQGDRSPAGAERIGGPGRRSGASGFHTDVPARPLDIVLGRPTARSITVSLQCYADSEVEIIYGTRPGALDQRTARSVLRSGQPQHLELGGLLPDTRYYYQVRTRPAAGGEPTVTPEYSFTTARPAGAPFTFTIQADSHLDTPTSPENYVRSLANALSSRPDFHVDLGDTFMTDKYLDYTDAAPQYLAQRYYFGLIGHSVPVYLVLGNHDGETRTRGSDGMALWSNGMRKRYFANPEPNDFYTGNTTPYRDAGLLQNYYAWQWGDALFVVLDPFWYTTSPTRDGDNWPRTLGRAQYDWLSRTLASSPARYKFIFIHHLAGGESREGRGGAEASAFFEWGGRNLDGSDVFETKRPGWPMPVHDLLRKYKVSAVFHGHDHLYVKQERDGIIYQEVPQPGHAHGTTRSAEEYGYRSGVILPSPGILRVQVDTARAQVEYVRADASASVADRYVILPAERTEGRAAQ